jgi:hypothetical protein
MGFCLILFGFLFFVCGCGGFKIAYCTVGFEMGCFSGLGFVSVAVCVCRGFVPHCYVELHVEFCGVSVGTC